jgi:predicted DNA-binding protein (UPF0251 family)
VGLKLNEVIGSWEGIDPKAVEIAKRAAGRTWSKYRDFVDLPDLESEAFTLVLTNEDYARLTKDEDYGYLQHSLEQDLMNHCEMAFHTPRNDGEGRVIRPDHSAIARNGRTSTNGDGEKVYQQTHVEWDQHLEDEEERISLHEESVPGGYTEEQIRLLLPAVWDESYAYGLPAQATDPDKDMPKAAGNKARSNSHWAYIADIKTGWKKADLTLDERRAILLQFGLGWAQRDIAYNQQVDQSTISRRVNNAIKKIKARLNGESDIEEE